MNISVYVMERDKERAGSEPLVFKIAGACAEILNKGESHCCLFVGWFVFFV